MVINIAVGRKFSQLKLFLYTNNFFESPKYTKLISHRDKNYTIEIRRKMICILLANSSNQEDLKTIREYIEKVFKNSSILIDSNVRLDWLREIKNVKITTI